MKILPTTIKKILLKSGFVSEIDIDRAIKSAKELNKPIEDILLFKGLISESVLGQLIGEHLGVTYIKLGHRVIPLETLDLVPENIARNYKVLPFEKKEDKLHLAMEDPKNLEVIEILKRKTNLKIVPFYITSPDFNHAISQYKRNIKKDFEKIISENVKKTGKVDKKQELAKAASELPVVEILNTILEYAIAESASDVHIEIADNEVVVRLRVDGVLRDIITLPNSIHAALIARIKILANLKIDEHRMPQDGRFKYGFGEEFIALRVSILPGFYGENAVMRLLFESARPLSLEELGFTGTNLEGVTEQIKKPHGMILVTGPTGCGKTTTLYSILNMLNSIGVKVCTIEDPIEYDIRRLTQVQVNPKTGLTFSSGLRSLLRHDPDIIMVGEIRDKETAEIAVHSALTGHLVLSTLHTNDASGAIPRFIDMGVEPFLLTSTVNLIIAQRLVRRICTSCIDDYKPEESRLIFFRKEFGALVAKQKFYHGKGCEECDKTGYKGRMGIFEVMAVNEEIRQLTLVKASSEKIKLEGKKAGMKSMIEDGLDKIASGMTTLEEVLRVARE
ncbi:GspE/PulE family protein [Patescibacteria group bacterium]